MTKGDDEIILECLENIWSGGTDEPYYEDNPKSEEIRQRLIKKYRKKLGRRE